LAAVVASYSRLIGAEEEGKLARLKAHRGKLVDRRSLNNGQAFIEALRKAGLPE
jgi:hypothetical protein